MNQTKNINRVFNVIDNSLFMITGKLDYARLTDSIVKLAELVHAANDTDDIWYIGECGNCCLPDLIIGAYWHYGEWCNGQWSPEYAANCALGQVFKPGMSSIEDDNAAYMALNALAESQ